MHKDEEFIFMAKRTNSAVWMENQKRWQINVQKDGIRRSFTSSKAGRTGQREANAKADAWLEDNITNENEKISKIFEIYINECKEVYSKSMYTCLQSRYDTWMKPVIGNVKISALNEYHLQKIINNAYSAGKSRKTLMNLRADLYAFVKYCRKRKYTTLFPESVTIPKDADFKEKHILMPDDLKKLFTCDKTIIRKKEQFEPLIYAFRFHVLTGLRPGELLGLEWNDIDLESNTVHIQRSINKFQETTKGKNKSANRIFALSGIAAEVLRHKINSVGRVFGDITPIYYSKHWHSFCEHNGISKVTPYELRHTFVSVSAEMPEGMLQKLVGHTKSMDSFGTYGHAYNEMRKQTAEKSNEIWQKVLGSDKT